MVKALLRHPAFQSLLVRLLSAYGWLVLATARVRVVTPAPAFPGPVIFALWHQQIFTVPLVARVSPHPLKILSSASRDGQLTRALAARWGIGAVVGSSHRGGFAAVRELMRAARPAKGEAPSSLLLTPDGPRGPACVAKPGTTELARLTGLPLIPAAAWCSRGHTFASWDKFRLPYPFTTFTIAYGAALPHPDPQQLAQSLNALTAKAQAACAACQN